MRRTSGAGSCPACCAGSCTWRCHCRWRSWGGGSSGAGAWRDGGGGGDAGGAAHRQRAAAQLRRPGGAAGRDGGGAAGGGGGGGGAGGERGRGKVEDVGVGGLVEKKKTGGPEPRGH